MPRTCTICGHGQRAAIETAIAAGTSLRSIAHQYGTTHTALARHRDNCGALAVAEARHVVDGARVRTVRDELEQVFRRVNLLFDACDRWLRDADDATQYELGPRAHEVKVTYLEPTALGVLLPRKKLLSELLADLQGAGVRVTTAEYKYADPRKLIVATAAQLTHQIELLAKLTGELKEAQQINIVLMPEWLALRDRILEVLTRHPAALDEVSRALGQSGG